MPLHALLDDVLLPERDIVPTHVRWRDDVLLIILWIFGFAAWAGTIAVMIMR
jgi:hypothetical protein